MRGTVILFSAKKPPERPEDAIGKGRRSLGETLQLVGELHLLAAMDFARSGRNFVGWQIDFVSRAGRFAAGGSKMV